MKKIHLAKVVVLSAWLIFIVSFFLPTTNALEMPDTKPGTPLTGWQAFILSQKILAIQPLTILAEPRTVLFLTFPFINLAMLFAPLAILMWEDAWILSGVFVPCGLFPWIFPKDVTGELFAGFYLWDASFFVMALGSLLASFRWRRFYK
jgi:hypothetical protein